MRPWFRWTLIIIAVSAVALGLLAAAGAWWGAGLLKDARAGQAHAESGARALAAQDTADAASEFAAATDSLSAARKKLGPAWVGGAIGALPWAGRQYRAAAALVEIGLDGSAAGSEITAGLKTASASTDATSGPAKIAVMVTTSRPHLEAALASLSKAAETASGLETAGLVAQLQGPVAKVKDALGQAQPLIGRGMAILELERYLFSKTRRLLVVSQDNAELKPTGGFMGSFGIVQTGPDGIKLEKYADVYTLPEPVTKEAPPPGARMSGDSFTFRDSNWWIDFPTSARKMLKFWNAAGQPKVDGVVAIDVITIRDLLKVLGPVRVKSFGETFTADNLLPRLLQLMSSPQPNRKGPLVALATEVEKRLFAADSTSLGKAALGLADSADSKHVQMYFIDPAAQASALELGWSGSVVPPLPGVTDRLVISNAMVSGSKVNIAVDKTIGYAVGLQAGGSARTRLVLSYRNSRPYELGGSERRGFGRRYFRDYLRVNRSPGTTFPVNADGTPVGGGEVTTEYGLPTIIRTFKLWRMRSHDEIIDSTITRGAWRDGAAPTRPRGAAATGTVNAPSAGPARYRLFLVRQADLQDIPTTIKVAAPKGWRVETVSAWNASSGAPFPASVRDGAASLSIPLTGDLVLDVGLVRQ